MGELGVVYKWTNVLNERSNIGEAEDSDKRYAEHLDPFNYTSSEMFWDMTTMGLHNFTYEIKERDIYDVNERRIFEDKWTQIHDSKRNGYNGGCKGRRFSLCPADAENFRKEPSLPKTYDSFNVNESHIGRRVLYRWQVSNDPRRGEPEPIERIGRLYAINRRRRKWSPIAIIPIAPLAEYPCEHIRFEDVLALLPEPPERRGKNAELKLHWWPPYPAPE